LVGLSLLTGGPSFQADIVDTGAVDECHDRLHRVGWSVGETCFQTDAGVVWQVDGTNGENRLLARAPTQAAAWRQAVEQAATVGMPRS
jgi:hypothetical protein